MSILLRLASPQPAHPGRPAPTSPASAVCRAARTLLALALLACALGAASSQASIAIAWHDGSGVSQAPSDSFEFGPWPGYNGTYTALAHGKTVATLEPGEPTYMSRLLGSVSNSYAPSYGSGTGSYDDVLTIEIREGPFLTDVVAVFQQPFTVTIDYTWERASQETNGITVLDIRGQSFVVDLASWGAIDVDLSEATWVCDGLACWSGLHNSEITFTYSPIPEPGAAGLALFGLAGLGLRGRSAPRRRPRRG